jgi:type I restriction enzyme S subunit
LIIGRKGTVGATYYCTEPCWPIDTVFFAEAPTDKDLRFFKYLLDHLQLERMDRSTAVPGLSRDDYNATEVLIPELDQQRLIVAEIEKQFSRLDEAVASLKRIKANFKRYKAAVLKAAVEGKLTEDWRKAHPDVELASKLLERILAGRRAKWKGKGKYHEPTEPEMNALPLLPNGWAWCLTDALLSFVTSGSRGWARYYSDEGPLFLRIGNLDHDSIRLDLKDIQRVKPPEGAEGTRTKVEKGDILVSITADVGMIAVVPPILDKAYINQHIALARPVSGIYREYLAWYLAARDGGQKEFRRLQRGATKVGLGLDDIRAVPVPLPPLNEQHQIVAEVDRRLSVVEELEATVETNLKRADRLRQSVLLLAFSGRLGKGVRSASAAGHEKATTAYYGERVTGLANRA